MDKIVTENLFLLEFLVDNVRLDPSFSRDIGDAAGDTCVSVQFLDNPPLDICEDDFTPKRKYSQDTGNLKSGKSCLFSLTPNQAEEAVYQFDVYVSVFKKMHSGGKPEKMQVGNSLISIVNLFNELIASINKPSSESTPAAKTLKDIFQITNGTGQYIGDIGMYIRMSCFGKLIVTQFQMNLDDKSVLFKDKEGHSLYRYKKAGQKSGNESAGGGGVRNSQCPSVPCSSVPCPPPTPCIPSQTYVTPCNTCAQAGQSSAMDPSACYQEIGASMGGNALTIRVHKEKKLEQVEGDDDTCTCLSTFQTNKTRAAGGGSCQIPEQNLVMGPRSEDGGTSNQPFSFKLGGCGMGAQNNVTVVPPVCTAPDGTQYTELSDPNRDVFILRIGKKSEGVVKKSNLELELCTPKGPDIKPPPKKETRDTQWDTADAIAAGGGLGSASGEAHGAGAGNSKKKGKK